MRKLFTLMTVAMLAATGSYADWTPSDKSHVVLTDYNDYGQMQMKTLRAKDGSIVLTWLQYGDKLYSDPLFGYNVHLQIFDAKGNAKFGNGGKVVVEQPTLTYTTDYGLQFADNGDILLAYNDVRADTQNRSRGDVYIYRFNMDGEPVWPKHGVKFEAPVFKNGGRVMAPQLAVCGKNIFASGSYVERYREKADSTNWEPSPYFPDEEMPDSVDLEYSMNMLQCYDADGKALWEKPLEFATERYQIAPCGSDLYLVYANDSLGLSARRINTAGSDVWENSVVVEAEPLSTGSYFPESVIESDGQDGIMLFYRKLTEWNGYMVMNRLRPDGTTLGQAVILNGSTEGDGNNVEAAVNNGKVMTAWSYSSGNNSNNLWMNELTTDGAYVWTGDREYGISMGENTQWGFKAVKVIPQSNGWVTLYGDCQSWNGANFMVVKTDDKGDVMWQKQIDEDNMTSTSFSVVYDENRAYIFYTCDREYDENWEEIPDEGGMRVLCVDISDSNNPTVLDGIETESSAEIEIYDLQGVKVEQASRPGVYVIRQNGKVRKMMVK